MPDAIVDAHLRSRAELLPLPVTCLTVPSVHQEPQCMYLQTSGSPPRVLSPASSSATSIGAEHRCLAEGAAATPRKPEVEPLQYQRENAFFGTRHS